MALIEPFVFIKLTAYFLLALTAFIVIVNQEKWEKHKKLLFFLFIIPVVLSTFYLVGHTVHKNIISETKGPIHWHVDFEVIACGESLDLVDPKGLSNKIGSPLFHEHNDNRLHVEGTVKHVDDILFDDFFRIIGGELKLGILIYDVEGEGLKEFRDGELCPNGKAGYVQMFVNGEKVDSFEYLYYPHALVPPGDCIVVEFGPQRDTHDFVCPSWQVQGLDYTNYKEKREGINAYGRSWEGEA